MDFWILRFVCVVAGPRAHPVEAMGQIPKRGFRLHDLTVKTGKQRSNVGSDCGSESMAFLACLEKHGPDSALYKAAKTALENCMGQIKPLKNKHKPTINFHLQKAFTLLLPHPSPTLLPPPPSMLHLCAVLSRVLVCTLCVFSLFCTITRVF